MSEIDVTLEFHQVVRNVNQEFIVCLKFLLTEERHRIQVTTKEYKMNEKKVAAL